MRPLSPREQDILDAAASGLTYGEMGRRFYLAESTVKNTASRLLRKMRARTIAHAVAKWMRVRDAYMDHRARRAPDLSCIVGDVPPLPVRDATLDEYIAAHLTHEGDCTLWTGAMERGSRPIVHTTRTGVTRHLSVRRYLYEARYGPLSADVYVHGACPHGRLRCVSHLSLAHAGPPSWRARGRHRCIQS